MESPHGNQPVLERGRSLDSARAAVVLVHGRGASATDILSLAAELDFPELAYLAPEAAGHTWYPYSFLSPIEQNQPWLDSALSLLGETVKRVTAAGIPRSKIGIVGVLSRCVSGKRICGEKRIPLWRPHRVYRRAHRSARNQVYLFWRAFRHSLFPRRG